MNRQRKLLVSAVTAYALVLMAPGRPAYGYAVFTHESIIEFSWRGSIRPLLIKRFTGATENDLETARGYAYGGALIQDLGYFPGSNPLFSDLTHYVRSGDFAEALIKDATTLNEYAFALGALEHYAADSTGHPLATNLAVAIYHPELKAKFGGPVTYEQDPRAHSQAELGFDVVEVVERLYQFDTYDHFTRFEIAEPLLERAFKEVYGLELNELLSVDVAISSYRYSVSRLLPLMTGIAWELKRREIILKSALGGITRSREQVIYQFKTAPGERNKYKEPGVFKKFLIDLTFIPYELGLLKRLDYATPTEETSKLFRASFIASHDRYRKLLEDVEGSSLHLENSNLDTGVLTKPGDYEMADGAYGKLVVMLSKNRFQGVRPELRDDILAFYGDPTSPNKKMKDKVEWKTTMRAVEGLKRQ